MSERVPEVLPARVNGGAVVIPPSQDELSVEQIVAQVQKIQSVQATVMKDGDHYGVVPGTEKPTLLKPGAEKLCLTFRLGPRYPEVEERFDASGHYHVRAKCVLHHIPTGTPVAEGLGSCTTRETKYAYRLAARKCPACGAEAIIKGKAEFGGGWLCWKKKDGCGTKFPDGAEAIESQPVGRVPNPELADSYNTVLKMACKRALVAAVLVGTAASDIFTQDLEDAAAPTEPVAAETPPAEPAEQAKPKKATRPQKDKLGALLTDLQKEVAVPEGFENWNEWSKSRCREVYGVGSRADLTTTQMSEHIGELQLLLDEKGIPF